MLSALALYAAVLSVDQDQVQKFPIRHVPAETALAKLRESTDSLTGLSQIVYDPTDNSLIVNGSRSALNEFAKLLALIDFETTRTTVKVSHVSAKYLHDLLLIALHESRTANEIVPKGVTLKVDQESNSIVVEGPAPGVREMELLIPQFDVKPLTVTLDVQGSVPSLGRSLQNTVDVANNSEWTYSDATAGLKLVVKTRVNGDGTVTIVITGTSSGQEFTRVARLKQGQILYTRHSGTPATTNQHVYMVRDERIDEKAFLDGAPMSTFDPNFSDIKGHAANGELRLILRAVLKS